MAFLVSVLMVGAWGVDGGWMPLPTRPQQCCDPASLVFHVFNCIIGFTNTKSAISIKVKGFHYNLGSDTEGITI